MLYLAIGSLALASPPEQEVHPARQAQIDAVNNGHATWRAAAHPRFAAQAPGASENLLGVKGDWNQAIKDAAKRGEVHPFVSRSNAILPDSFDSEANWPQCAKTIGLIRDQSNCGCCWAFAGAEAASDRMCISSNATLLFPLSDQDVCFNSNFDGCGGGQISTPWSYIQRTGVVSGGLYKNNEGQPTGFDGMCSDFSLPHCHHHGPQGDDPYPAEGAPGCPSERSPRGPTTCDATAVAPHADFASDKMTFSGRAEHASGETQIMQMIMEGGPVETAFNVYEDFENYAGGIYHHVSGGMAGGHAVKMVGWGVDGGTKYWKVANSWNPYWGEKGYFRIVKGTNEGGIENNVIASSAQATWGKKSLIGA